MGISVAFLRPIVFDLVTKLEDGKSIIVRQDNQTNICEVGDVCMPIPKSTIKMARKSNNIDIYSVVHFSNTIKEPILLWQKFTGEVDQYQKKIIFDIIHNKSENEVYITAQKISTNEFLQRISSLESLKLARLTFNLNIKKIPDILNIYGQWCRVKQGNIKCTAKFGFDVQRTEQLEEPTALNMNVKTSSGLCDLTISKEGQISSHTKSTTVNDIIEFYHKIKNDLITKADGTVGS
jgi:tyrosyl-tRNA synthetase